MFKNYYPQYLMLKKFYKLGGIASALDVINKLSGYCRITKKHRHSPIVLDTVFRELYSEKMIEGGRGELNETYRITAKGLRALQEYVCETRRYVLPVIISVIALLISFVGLLISFPWP